jgi:hypothetical protein
MEKNPSFFILCAKNTFKNMAIFKAFLVTAITAATDYFLADYFHILKDLSIYYTIYHLLLIRGLCPSPS